MNTIESTLARIAAKSAAQRHAASQRRLASLGSIEFEISWQQKRLAEAITDNSWIEEWRAKECIKALRKQARAAAQAIAVLG